MWGRRRDLNLVDTIEMDAFFGKLDRLSLEQLMAMTAAWHSTGLEAHERSWRAVRAAGIRLDLTKEIDRIRDKAMAWASRDSMSVPLLGLSELSGVMSGQPATWQQVKAEAAAGIVDAALAIALGDRLDDASRDTLLGPWLRATEAMTE
jgi:hypothetical protein